MGSSTLIFEMCSSTLIQADQGSSTVVLMGRSTLIDFGPKMGKNNYKQV
jgi:hypothetical protein